MKKKVNLEELKNYTYVMIKPFSSNDKKNRWGEDLILNELLTQIKAEGLEVEEAAYIKYEVEDIKKHYAEHIDRSYYQTLENYLNRNVAYGMIVKSNDGRKDAVETIRKIVGSTIKVNKETGNIERMPENSSLRYKLPFIFCGNPEGRNSIQLKKYVYVPKNLEKVYNPETNSVEVYTNLNYAGHKVRAMVANMNITENFIHSSDSPKSAKLETQIFLDIVKRNEKRKDKCVKEEIQKMKKLKNEKCIVAKKVIQERIKTIKSEAEVYDPLKDICRGR